MSLLLSTPLLAQEPPEPPDPELVALEAALERAAAKDTRVAVLVSPESNAETEQLSHWWRRAELAGVPLRYEYELVHYKGSSGSLSRRLGTPLIEPRYPMVLCSAEGRVLGQRSAVLGGPGEGPAAEVLEARLGWLAEHKVAMPDAREHLAAALSLAKKTDRRVLVHLGAPW